MRSDAVSPKSVLGVMQLMPATARALNADPTDPTENIEAGRRLLCKLLIKYDNDAIKAPAAYHAGKARSMLTKNCPSYSETQNYVDKIIKSYQQAPGTN